VWFPFVTEKSSTEFCSSIHVFESSIPEVITSMWKVGTLSFL
jgi:hypothetical protein